MTPDNIATLTAALIGALLGSIGAVTVDHWLGDRSRDRQQRKLVAKQHLYQLLDALETLWYRVESLQTWSREIQAGGYFETSTLYAVGRALAQERVLRLEGVIAELAYTYPRLVSVFREETHEMFRKLGTFQYDRLILAESLLQWTGNGYRVLTYYEFQMRYRQQSEEDTDWRDIIKKVIDPLRESDVRDRLQEQLESVSKAIAGEIGVRSVLPGAAEP